MRAEIKVEFGWMGDSGVDGRSGRDVARLARLLLLVGAEQPGVMAFLDNDEGDSGLVIRFEFNASFTNGCQLVLQHLTNHSPLILQKNFDLKMSFSIPC